MDTGFENHIMKGSFIVSGDAVDKFMRGSFKIIGHNVEEPITKTFGFDNPSNIKNTGILGKTGTITERKGPFVYPVYHATILVKKDGLIYDKAETDELGNYTIFVPNGIYDIEITSESINREVRNYKIDDGITSAYATISGGHIYKKYSDATAFVYNNNGFLTYYKDWLINGQVLDFNDEPVDGAEIIISEGDNLVIYYATQIDGRYSFALPFGTYDVRIKLPKQHVKIARNVYFGGSNGFIKSVVENLYKG